MAASPPLPNLKSYCVPVSLPVTRHADRPFSLCQAVRRRAEAIIDQIEAFAARDREQGADVQLDVWKGMTHDFQAYGHELAESREALLRLGQVVNEFLAGG